MGHFTGTVTDDAPKGMPGTGTIDGYFGFPTIEFRKQMPVYYVGNSDGRMVTLREQSSATGTPRGGGFDLKSCVEEPRNTGVVRESMRLNSPPSPRPSPQGEGESSSVPQEDQHLNLPNRR
jgi:hypothetical protein